MLFRSTGLKSIRSYVYCYKHVRADLTSLYDPYFQYTIDEYAVAIDPDLDTTASCVSGLHVSNAHYWNNKGGEVVLYCRVHLDDVIAVQEGKIRCSKLFVVSELAGKIY